MRRKVLFFLTMVVILLCLSISVFAGEEWVKYKSDDYGFSMLVPEGTKFQEKEYEGGWGALYANYQGIQVWAIGKMGSPEKPEVIETYGVKITGVPKEYWKVIDKGKNSNGWQWYYTVKASDGKKVAYGGYGVGPRGSYLLVLITSKSDFEENHNDYLKWYTSIRLF